MRRPKLFGGFANGSGRGLRAVAVVQTSRPTFVFFSAVNMLMALW